VADYLKAASDRFRASLAKAKRPRREMLTGKYKRNADQDAYRESK
jgi:hypothetical protein